MHQRGLSLELELQAVIGRRHRKRADTLTAELSPLQTRNIDCYNRGPRSRRTDDGKCESSIDDYNLSEKQIRDDFKEYIEHYNVPIKS